MASGWHRKDVNSPAAKARAAEYRSPHYKAARAKAKAHVDAGHASCWRCGQPIQPGTRWDLGHDDNNRSIIRGPEHMLCNRRAAARKGNRISNTQRTTGQRRTQLTL